jgi:hypothetical protein
VKPSLLLWLEDHAPESFSLILISFHFYSTETGEDRVFSKLGTNRLGPEIHRRGGIGLVVELDVGGIS